MKPYIIAIDQGTTSTRAMVFNQEGRVVSRSQKLFEQHYPHKGWVEHDPQQIWRDTVSVCRDALFHQSIAADEVAGIGITNQRETTVVWDRKTGQAIYPAIVWQDRRTSDYCALLKNSGYEAMVQSKTGLLLDPYFSASKIRWILGEVPGAHKRAENGELAFGTIDSFLIWQLTGGRVHATDATNAARTLLFNIHTGTWDAELLQLFEIPEALLPEVKDCCDDFGETDAHILGASVPIAGVAGDQSAATVGQACLKRGMTKTTFGTGAFMMLNTGQQAIRSTQRLLTTVAYQIKGQTTYALEGSVFIAGAVMQWCQEQAGFFDKASQTDAIARSVEDTHGVYFVPAFTGLGAPYWQPNARGAIVGLTRDSGIAHMVRAALESIAYQSRDLLMAMQVDCSDSIQRLRVDGGVAANDWLCQFLADVLAVEVERPEVIETTALGAALLAAYQVGWFSSLAAVEGVWQCQNTFTPKMAAEQRQQLCHGWNIAVRQVLVGAD